jgi:sulfur transfer complex TusBCD TusB component (DsrH family)
MVTAQAPDPTPGTRLKSGNIVGEIGASNTFKLIFGIDTLTIAVVDDKIKVSAAGYDTTYIDLANIAKLWIGNYYYLPRNSGTAGYTVVRAGDSLAFVLPNTNADSLNHKAVGDLSGIADGEGLFWDVTSGTFLPSSGMLWIEDNDSTISYVNGDGDTTARIYSNSVTSITRITSPVGNQLQFGDPGVTQVDSLLSVILAYYAGTLQEIDAASETIAIDAAYIRVSANHNLTMSSNPTIGNGILGQFIRVVNSSDSVLTLQDGVLFNLRLGASTRALGKNDSIELFFDGDDWIEVGFTNVQ